MRVSTWLSAGLGGAVLLSGCQGVPYKPGTNNDATPPRIGIRVSGDAPTSTWNATTGTFGAKVALVPVDVAEYVPGTPVTPVSVQVHEHGEASVLATAQDDESGVRSLKLDCQRRTYYNYDPAGPTESNAVLAVVTTQQNNQVTNGQAPLSALTQQNFNMWGQMLFPSAQGTPIRAHRVGLTCSAEASNFNGFSSRSGAVLVWAQDHAVQP